MQISALLSELGRSVLKILDNRIQMFEANGEFCKQIGCKGEDPGQLMYPYGLAVDSLDNIYVCDLGWRSAPLFVQLQFPSLCLHFPFKIEVL